MTTTPRLGAPELVSAQATPEATVNEQIRYVEQGASYFIVKDKDLTSAPGSPSDGDAYIVATGATGTWSGKDGLIAFRMSTGWLYITPIEGTLVYAQDENARYIYSGTAWGADSTGAVALDYILGPFFTSTPTASEVLLLNVAGRAFTLAANLSGALQSYVGTNPTASFALDVQKNGATIATITVSTSGVVTATTTGGTSKSIAAGDIIKVAAPASADATAANMAFTIIGAR